MTSELWEPITGTVVRIVDEYTVIIDVGYEDGVTLGMKFVIYTEGQNIYTPRGKKLEKIEYPKAKVEVVHVQKKLSLAQSSEFVSEMASEKIAKALASMATISGRRRKELPVDANAIQKLTPVDMKVKVGDKVRQIEPTPKT